MIFNNTEATRLYNLYHETGNSHLISQIHQLADPLIKSIACTVTDDDPDDLIQEGHIKLYEIIREHKFEPNRGSFYSFLSVVLRYRMIHLLRHEQRRLCDELDPNMVMAHNLETTAVIGPPIEDYITTRFSSLHPTVAKNAARYIIDGFYENPNERSWGVVRTLQLLYPLNRTEAYVFYNAVLVFLRLYLSNELKDKNIIKALQKAQITGECSMLPEVVLVTGDSQHLMHTMEGMYVRF